MSASRLVSLTTERLFLREIQLEDVEEIFRLRADESVNAMIDRKSALSIDDTIEFIRQIIHNKAMMWAITLIGEAKLIGTIVYWHIEWENKKAEIGYELLPEYQGNGIMTEALKKVIAFGFEELCFKTITAESKAINLRSVKLLEKSGFEKRKQIDNGYVIYEMTVI
jgi:ribosomal-protein-alanine N-acetyltransferase